jgi:two-component system phosphate regulon sensor histidine kinase PhoR
MKKELRFLFIVCTAAMIGIVVFQTFWLKNYFQLSRERFEQESNLAFEDAVRREFEVRNDTLEQLLYEYLSDTNKTRITSGFDSEGKTKYFINDVTDSKFSWDFGYSEFQFPITSATDTNRLRVARLAAKLYREEDLDRHIIHYKPQNLGKYIGAKADSLSFDTARLRPILKLYLARREINEQFVFKVTDIDSSFNQNIFVDSLTTNYEVITKSFPTYKNVSNYRFVRAMFPSISGYLYAKNKLLLSGSVILILIVAASFYSLLSVIKKQKKLSEIKNDFINNITHEFKTPIATVFSAVEALDDFNVVADPERARKYLRTSKRELERLSGLVTKILNTSLYENASHEFKTERVDIDGIIKEIIHVHRMAAGKELKFIYTNSSRCSLISGDKAHIYNSMHNVIDNAIKYSRVEAEIKIQLYNKDTYLVISVEDNGIGIKKEDVPFVFDKFYRAANSGVKGYGLGLSYTKAIVDSHKGWCKVYSEFGTGSKFIIGLPAAYE